MPDIWSMRESPPDAVLTEPAPSIWERLICGVIITMLTGALIGPVFAPTQEETPTVIGELSPCQSSQARPMSFNKKLNSK